MQLLLDHGASIRSVDDNTIAEALDDILSMSGEDIYRTMALVFLIGADTNTGHNHSLCRICSKSDTKTLRPWQIHGALVKWRHEEYPTALRAAIDEASATPKHQGTTDYFLEDEADENLSQCGVLGSALQTASERGQAWLVKYLLEKGASVNHSDSHQGSPLHLARLCGQNLRGLQYPLDGTEHRCGCMDFDATIEMLLAHGAEDVAPDTLHT